MADARLDQPDLDDLDEVCYFLADREIALSAISQGTFPVHEDWADRPDEYLASEPHTAERWRGRGLGLVRGVGAGRGRWP